MRQTGHSIGVPRRVATLLALPLLAVSGALSRASGQDVDGLIAELGASDATTRATAACALGELEADAVRRARTPLLDLLADGTPVEGRLCRERENRWAGSYESSPGREAAIALEKLGTEVLEPLARILEGPEPVARENAALALGLVESDRAVDPLLSRLARDDAAPVRARSAWALGMIESAAAVDGLARALRGDADPETREQAAWGLGMIESAEGVTGLSRAVDDPSAGVREQVAWGLGMIESTDAVEPLLRLLRDAEADVREQAAWGLGMVEDREGTAGLIDALRDDDAGVRAQAAWALGMIEDPAALDALLDALEDENENVREQAMWALSQVIREVGLSEVDRSDLADRLRRALGRDPMVR